MAQRLMMVDELIDGDGLDCCSGFCGDCGWWLESVIVLGMIEGLINVNDVGWD